MRNSRRTRRENKELVLLPPLRVPCGRGAEGVPAAIGQLVRPRRRPSSVQAPPRTSSRSCARLELRRALWGCRRPAAALASQRKSSRGSRRRLVGWVAALAPPTKSGIVFLLRICAAARTHTAREEYATAEPRGIPHPLDHQWRRRAAFAHSSLVWCVCPWRAYRTGRLELLAA
jgi:hypothetical protein